jgi:hypothetical protein
MKSRKDFLKNLNGYWIETELGLHAQRTFDLPRPGLAGVAHTALPDCRAETAHDDSAPTRGQSMHWPGSGARFMGGELVIAPLPVGEGCLADEKVLPVMATELQRPHTARF